jgi:hypothetical protein
LISRFLVTMTTFLSWNPGQGPRAIDLLHDRSMPTSPPAPRRGGVGLRVVLAAPHAGRAEHAAPRRCVGSTERKRSLRAGRIHPYDHDRRYLAASIVGGFPRC